MKRKKKKLRKILPGELESVKASEEVTRRNINMMIEFEQDTRKMLKELLVMFDALQGNVMNMKSDLDELRRQLAIQQQINCSKGTVDYGNKC